MNIICVDRCQFLFNFLAGEWILKKFESNGGAVVALRAFWTTLIFSCLTFIAVSIFDPLRLGPISWRDGFEIFWKYSDKTTLFLGASYLTLYARFVSQWSYLANLYNMIKQAESSKDRNIIAIAQWKAGYLEDAENLHLAGKNNLAPVLHAWANDCNVIKAYIRNTPGGVNRLRNLRCVAKRAFEKEEGIRNRAY